MKERTFSSWSHFVHLRDEQSFGIFWWNGLTDEGQVWWSRCVANTFIISFTLAHTAYIFIIINYHYHYISCNNFFHPHK